MSALSLIIDGIRTSLGGSAPTYTKLANELDISKNKFKASRKGYALQVSTGDKSGSPIQSLFTTTTVNLVFLRTFRNTTGDSNQVTALIDLQQTILDAYICILNDWHCTITS